MAVEKMLTTVDNPYDPFTEFEQWHEFDTRAGYYTLAFIGRVLVTSDELSEADQEVAIDNAIDEIVELNVIGVYKLVTREVPDTTSTAA